MAIGFSTAPENVDETWPKQHRGRTFTFTKARKGQHHFIYNCSRTFEDSTVKADTSTGIVLDRELTRAEVEGCNSLWTSWKEVASTFGIWDSWLLFSASLNDWA